MYITSLSSEIKMKANYYKYKKWTIGTLQLTIIVNSKRRTRWMGREKASEDDWGRFCGPELQKVREKRKFVENIS